MNTHPDWKDDKKLWEVLGKIPQNRPSTNFLHVVLQKVEEKEHVSTTWVSMFFQLPRFVRMGALVASAACVVFSLILLNPSSDKTGKSSHSDSMEIVELAQNFELIKDFDVIENLDQL